MQPPRVCLIRVKAEKRRLEEINAERATMLSSLEIVMRLFNLAAATVAVLALVAVPAAAANYDVQMLNKGEAGTMVFEPALTSIAVGDTVTFVATDKGHNAETIVEILPDGAEVFKGKVSQD